MHVFRTILRTWALLVLVAIIASLVLPKLEESLTVQLVYALMLLIGLLSLHIFHNEPVESSKPIFLNFGIFFLIASLQFVHLFVQHAFFGGVPYANVYSYQYLLLSLYPFAQTFAIGYVVVDSFFRQIATCRKYALTFLITGAFFTYHYYPILVDPQYLYETPDIEDFRTIDRAVAKLSSNGGEFTARDVGSILTLPAWRDGKLVGTLSEDAETRRIEEILPYLAGTNYVLLIYRPLFQSVVYMNLFCVAFILLFFAHQYRRDPPRGAYVEKIVFLCLPLASFEALHFFAYSRSVEYETFQHLANLGHYLTLANLILLGVFFALRLHFITSVSGKFYERKLIFDAAHITRWRDGIDNLIIRHFFRRKSRGSKTPQRKRTSRS